MSDMEHSTVQLNMNQYLQNLFPDIRVVSLLV